MTKQQRIIFISVLAVILVLVVAVGGYFIASYSSASGERTSGGFTYDVDGNVVTITKYSGSDTQVTIPAKIGGKRVAKIAAGAFSSSKVTDIVFSDDIAQIELADGCFKGLTTLAYVKLPDSLKEIPANCFEDCTALNHIALPASLTSIGDSAFEGCTSLSYSGSSSDSGKITLPQTLTYIGAEAFMDCSKISSLVIGGSLKEISKSAFEDCSMLSKVDFGSDSAVSVIGDRAFYNTRLNGFTLPETLTEIGDYAFYGDSSSSFTSLNIPAAVETVGEYAFAGCTYLKTVTFGENSKITSLGEGVFKDNRYLTTISLPTSVTKIPKLAFNGCGRLIKFEIGAQITEIGEGAFGGIATDSTGDIAFTVNAENKNFTLVKLDDYYKVSTTSKTAKSHYLLMNKDKSVLHAYIGQFNSEDCINEEGDATANAFDFLLSAEVTKSLKTIGGYAFTGVKADKICIPRVVTEVGAYCFTGSKAVNIYFEDKDCKLDEKVFEGIDSRITVLSLTGEGSISEFVDNLGDGNKYIFGKANGWPK